MNHQSGASASDISHGSDSHGSDAPHPGSSAMPQWNVGELPAAPLFSWRSLPMFLGPGLIAGSAAIGGGEWLTGPLNTAKYGAAMLWLATFSILGQVIYNIEISRYTLYTGEPIFTGKFRTLPGPKFWLFAYLFLDLGSFLPYLASNAAIPLGAVILGKLPNPNVDGMLLKGLAVCVFLGALLPLLFGGKVYSSLKVVMTFKLIYVMAFLMFLAIFFSTPATWWEIISGFFRFGTAPIVAPKGSTENTANLLAIWWQGGSMPAIDWSGVGILAAMAALAGNGGLTNTPTSNYTRDQGWGMGKHVGAIPSIFGRHAFSLSHVGMIFHITAASLRRWRDWLWHVQREQLFVWMPACFIGLALPSMLSVQFLTRGTAPADKWQAAAMTAEGVGDAVGAKFGDSLERPFWYLTLFCGFLVLGTSMVATADGFLRRWVDVCWTASPQLRRWDSSAIGRLYFGVLCAFGVLGSAMLMLVKGDVLLVFATMLYNYALGVSCFHVLFVNTLLLPKEIRPGWGRRIGLVFAGVFFTMIAVVVSWDEGKKLAAKLNTKPDPAASQPTAPANPGAK